MKYAFFLLVVLLGSTNIFAQQPDTKVTLGIKPDYFFGGPGVSVKGVVQGKTAQKAGIKAGDVITAFDEEKIKGIFHYRDLLNEYAPGDKVKVTVKRNQKTLTFTIRF